MDLWLEQLRSRGDYINFFINNQGFWATIKNESQSKETSLTYLVSRPDQEGIPVDVAAVKSTTFLRGREFITKEILTTEPLGVFTRISAADYANRAGSGLSGAWVVNNMGLHSILFAIFNDQPRALILPANRVFEDIKKAYPNFSGVKITKGPGYRKAILMGLISRISDPVVSI